ncbi:membrane integrity-associated transporter subunit PqiC [Glaciimonas sp. PAMC28666]|uniref:PqiC family protein n=1 Tax=Glaciimonas sp. PAMC28666 TaxID=2807626 RepID=UPI0019646640|nr:PqiC family protein [Glaciimonas sp. PAMC28666]QRX82042.1 membrane integrity-associated transporter subunit PqiC [Glaciimonas sp. PAMC28666]
MTFPPTITQSRAHASYRQFVLCSVSAIAAVTVLAGCSVTPTRFYTLAVPSATGTSKSGTAQNIYIEVPPVGVPERLARPQLVVRAQNTRVDILEQDRWSSSFNYELHDALASGLADKLGAVDVTRGGHPSDSPSYRIAVDLREFDAAPGDKVQALFGWTITRSDNGSSASCQLAVTEPVSAGMDALVAGVQRAVADTVNGIVANVGTLASGSPTQCRGS